MKPAPVTVSRPDGESGVIGAREFRHGARPVAAEESSPDDRPLDELTAQMEEKIVRTLIAAMQTAEHMREKIGAASTAIKYLAVKAKLPIAVGGGFEEKADD